jgi:hypothetical protein
VEPVGKAMATSVGWEQLWAVQYKCYMNIHISKCYITKKSYSIYAGASSYKAMPRHRRYPLARRRYPLARQLPNYEGWCTRGRLLAYVCSQVIIVIEPHRARAEHTFATSTEFRFGGKPRTNSVDKTSVAPRRRFALLSWAELC